MKARLVGHSGSEKETRTGERLHGVGPDQNFTYIAALRPKVAFIVDIRRQNMLLHLMYKALFELSVDRTDFLAKLFGRPAPAEAGQDSDAASLFKRVSNQDSDADFAKRTLTACALAIARAAPLCAVDR